MYSTAVGCKSPAAVVVLTATTYAGPFVYQNDTLQYVAHEEGRIRYNLADSSYKYDFYISDHLGNVRMTLTEQTETDSYQATMEPKNAAVEDALFDSVSTTQYPVPTGFEPTTGADTSNHYVSRLNASSSPNLRVGPTLLLRVMAGDTLTASTYCWYNATPVQPTNDPSLLNTLATLFANNVLGLPNSKYITSQQSALTTAAGPGFTSLLSTESSVYSTSAPKAFLNWALLDDRFNYVQGGVAQVPVITDTMHKQVLQANLPTVIPKNGYLYVYVSNESPQDVFFDNVTIQHHRGPLLEEEHYYPFGLSMAGISSQAAGKLENLHKYNKGSELQHKEFSDGSGLELYTTEFRAFDPQIGRWWQVDPKPNVFESPYASMSNNPILHDDPLGDTVKHHSFKDRVYTTLGRLFSRAFRQEYRQLKHSTETYEFAGFEDPKKKGQTTTDGKTIQINYSFNPDKSTGEGKFGEMFHEAVHAVQFDNGEFGFANIDGEWKAVNADIWEEYQAYGVGFSTGGKALSYNTDLGGGIIESDRTQNGIWKASSMEERLSYIRAWGGGGGEEQRVNGNTTKIQNDNVYALPYRAGHDPNPNLPVTPVDPNSYLPFTPTPSPNFINPWKN